MKDGSPILCMIVTLKEALSGLKVKNQCSKYIIIQRCSIQELS